MTTSRNNTIMSWMAYTDFLSRLRIVAGILLPLNTRTLLLYPGGRDCIGAAGVDAYLLWMIFATLDSTVSAHSTTACSQTCGQKPLSEHPHDRAQKAVFHSLPECRGRMLRRSGLPHCTSAGEVKQVLYAGTGGAEFASL